MTHLMSRTIALLPVLAAPSFHTFAQTPTWSEDVACIVYSHCSTCHRPNGPGHFDLTSYADAYYWRVDMKNTTQVRFMPPWPPDEGYRSLAHERVLTEQEIDIIAAWVDGGAPEGPPEAAPPPPVFTHQNVITDPDITAVMETYQIPLSTSDIYRCFVLEVDNPTDRYIQGLEVIPGNPAMVHHVLVFQDTTGQARLLDDADSGPGYTSFGGISVNSAKLIGVWAPGSEPLFTPAGMGIKLFADADIVIQVHYPYSDGNEIDSTRINIGFIDGGGIREVSIDPLLDHLGTMTNGPLVIPPNEVRTFHSQRTIPVPGILTAVGPHGHLICRSLKSYAVLPSGVTVPLIDIPNWNFHWQGMYRFRRPIFLPAGTVLHGEGVYDNTLANPLNPNNPPQWVSLGESTTDEMMLFYFAWTIGTPADTNIVVADSQHTMHHLDCSVDHNVGLQEAETISLIEAWPVPARDVLHVSTGQEVSYLVLLDMAGRKVSGGRGTGPLRVMPVADLARGPYLLELHDLNGGILGRVKVLLE